MRQVALQAAAIIAVLSLAWPYHAWVGEALPWLGTSLAIGAFAFLLASLNRLPWPWRLLHGGLFPLLYLSHEQAIDPGWLLLLVILALWGYRSLVTGQIPQLLSRSYNLQAIFNWQQEVACHTMLALGQGSAWRLIPLADALPECRFVVIEERPWCIALSRLLACGRRNLSWQNQNALATMTPGSIVWLETSSADQPADVTLLSRLPPACWLLSNARLSAATPEHLLGAAAGSTPVYCYRT